MMHDLKVIEGFVKECEARDMPLEVIVKLANKARADEITQNLGELLKQVPVVNKSK